MEAGVSGYHIEDQRPGTKVRSPGRQRCWCPPTGLGQAAPTPLRFQLDIMKGSGIIVARTDAGQPTLIDGRADEPTSRSCSA